MFKFKCNNTKWTIKEVDEATMNNWLYIRINFL